MSITPKLKGLLTAQIPRPTVKQVFAGISVISLMALCYVFGAAAMHFQWPTSDYLRNAFWGAEAWQERGQREDPTKVMLAAPAPSAFSIDKPDKTEDGFTLYSTTSGSWAALIDMKGNVVHDWRMPFSQAFPKPVHVKEPLPDRQIHWFRCRLFPNGDLLAIYHADGDTPYGYGLIKLDKDSRLLWAYASNVHHDFDIGPDGKIYALTQKNQDVRPKGMEYLPTPFIADSLVILSAGGEELDQIPLMEAFRDSPYASLLEMSVINAVSPGDPRLGKNRNAEQAPDPPLPPDLSKLPPDKLPPGMPDPNRLKVQIPGKVYFDVKALANVIAKGDYTHANGVRLLPESMAPKFPFLKAGQVLISLRNLDALAVVDTHSRSAVKVIQGCWRRQHAPDFLDNGHLLIYDNAGANVQSRVLEYDPVYQTMPWSYSNENSVPFLAAYRGATQRLPRGNTLIVHPEKCRIFEVTPAKEVVWETVCLDPSAPTRKNLSSFMTSARRYPAETLTFLKPGIRPRP